MNDGNDWLIVMKCMGRDWVLKTDAESKIRRARFRPIKVKKGR